MKKIASVSLRFEIVLALILIVGIGYQSYALETSISATEFQKMTDSEKLEFAKSHLKKLDINNGQYPDIVLAEKGPENLYGTFHSPSDNQSYSKPTIVLYPSAFDNLGQLDATLRHELKHFTIESSSPPKALEIIFNSLKTEIIKRFDFSNIPESLREGVINGVLEGAKRAAEELYISKEILEIADTFDDAANAVKLAKSMVDFYEKDYEEYFDGSQTVIMADGNEYKIQPKDSFNEETAEYNLTGRWNFTSTQIYCDIEHCPGDVTGPVDIKQNGSEIFVVYSTNSKEQHRYTLINNKLHINLKHEYGWSKGILNIQSKSRITGVLEVGWWDFEGKVKWNVTMTR